MIDRFRAARRDPSLVVLEGFHALKHALRFRADVLEAVTRDSRAVLDAARDLAPDLTAALAGRLRDVPADTFAKLAPHPPPGGVVALARRPAYALSDALAGGDPAPIVFLEEPTDLGNIGAAIRVAAAAGAAAVLTGGPHDPWHPAAVRGAAGLQFALPVLRVASLPALDRPLIAAAVDGEPLRAGLIPPRAVLAFGSERRGLTPALAARADLRVAIPMRPGVSSLNLATAVAVLLYAP